MNEMKKLIASLSTEIAIGTALAVVGLFVVIGLFNDNLADMAMNFKSKVFNIGSSSKTAYSSFNRDYSDSQINVQITGEQGLEMLRKKANNKALDLIANPFSEDNLSGDEIAYLSKVVEIISGEGHICIPMKDNSKKHCDDESIGGYKYKIKLEVGNLSITVKKVDKTGNVVSKTVIMCFKRGKGICLNTKSGSIIDSHKVPLNSDKESTYDTDEQYKEIKDLTAELEELIDNNVLLVNVLSTFKTESAPAGGGGGSEESIEGFKADLIKLLKQLSTSVSTANKMCRYNSTHSIEDSVNCCKGLTNSGKGGKASWYGEGKCWVNDKAVEDFKNWAKGRIETINLPEYSDYTQLFDLIVKDKQIDFVNILRRDRCNSDGYVDCSFRKVSCENFKNGITEINKKYGLDLNIPSCKPFNNKGK